MVGTLGSGSNFKCFEQMHRLISFDFMNCGRGLGSGIFSVADWHLNTSLFIRDHTYHIDIIYIYMYKIQLIVNSWDCQIYFHRYKPTFAAVLRAQGLQKIHCTCPSVEWGTWFQESHPHFKPCQKNTSGATLLAFLAGCFESILSFQLFPKRWTKALEPRHTAWRPRIRRLVHPWILPRFLERTAWRYSKKYRCGVWPDC